MDIIAHRLRIKPGQIGNNRENVADLRSMGIEWLEADAIFSADGEIIVYHPGSIQPDPTLVSKIFTEYSIKIMPLKDLLGLLAIFPNMKCLIDIKQNSPELVEKIITMVTNRSLQDRVYLTTFQKNIEIPFLVELETNAELLILAKNICPEIKTHLIATWPWNLPKLGLKYKPDAISFGWLLEPQIVLHISRFMFEATARIRNLEGQVAELKEMKIKVWSGICNNLKDMNFLAGLGVDGIVTDDALLGMTFKRQWEASNGR